MGVFITVEGGEGCGKSTVLNVVLEMLKKGRMSAGDIASNFDMTGATISYHLNILKKAELVRENKQKNFVFYELNTSVVEEVMLWLSGLKENHSIKEDNAE